jgi:hypothetical protein
MSLRRTTAALAGVALLVVPGLAQPPDAGGDKTPMFPHGRSFDFGDVPRGREVRHDFHIVNASDVPLTVQAVRVSNGAAKAKLNKKTLLPDELGTLAVSLDTRRFSGPKSIIIFLTIVSGGVTTESQLRLSVTTR